MIAHGGAAFLHPLAQVFHLGAAQQQRHFFYFFAVMVQHSLRRINGLPTDIEHHADHNRRHAQHDQADRRRRAADLPLKLFGIADQGQVAILRGNIALGAELALLILQKILFFLQKVLQRTLAGQIFLVQRHRLLGIEQLPSLPGQQHLPIPRRQDRHIIRILLAIEDIAFIQPFRIQVKDDIGCRRAADNGLIDYADYLICLGGRGINGAHRQGSAAAGSGVELLQPHQIEEFFDGGVHARISNHHVFGRVIIIDRIDDIAAVLRSAQQIAYRGLEADVGRRTLDIGIRRFFVFQVCAIQHLAVRLDLFGGHQRLIQARNSLIHQRQRRIGLGQTSTSIFGLLFPQHGLHVFYPLYANDPCWDHHAQHGNRQQPYAKAILYISTQQNATLLYTINQNSL